MGTEIWRIRFFALIVTEETPLWLNYWSHVNLGAIYDEFSRNFLAIFNVHYGNIVLFSNILLPQAAMVTEN